MSDKNTLLTDVLSEQYKQLTGQNLKALAPKKRGRKPKVKTEEEIQKGRKPKVIAPVESYPKKRGRKPKEKVYTVSKPQPTLVSFNETEELVLVKLPISIPENTDTNVFFDEKFSVYNPNLTIPQPSVSNNLQKMEQLENESDILDSSLPYCIHTGPQSIVKCESCSDKLNQDLQSKGETLESRECDRTKEDEDNKTKNPRLIIPPKFKDDVQEEKITSETPIQKYDPDDVFSRDYGDRPIQNVPSVTDFPLNKENSQFTSDIIYGHDIENNDISYHEVLPTMDDDDLNMLTKVELTERYKELQNSYKTALRNTYLSEIMTAYKKLSDKPIPTIEDLKCSTQQSKVPSKSKSISDISSKTIIIGKTRQYELNSEYTQGDSWPETTDRHCYWDGHPFDTTPIPIPISFHTKSKKFKILKIFFCSFNCLLAHSQNCGHPKKSLIQHFYKKFNNSTKNFTTIEPSHPLITLDVYGGPYNIEEYRSLSCNNTIKCVIYEPPIIPTVLTVEESNLAAYARGEPGKPNDLKLRRLKPLPNSKNTLENFLVTS